MNNQQFPPTSPPTPPPPTPPPIPPVSPQPAVVSLLGAGELLSKSFQIYKSRIGVFVGIMIIPFLVSLLVFGSAFLLKILKVPWIWFIVAIIGYFVLVIVNLWSGVSLLYAIKERDQKIGIKESFRKGWHKILSYWWISILVGLITIGGFLLFAVPGIIFAIWFSLALYVLVSEDIKGMNALFRSKQLIKGYWGKVFWRFLVMGLVVVVIVVPIAVIAGLFNVPFINNIMSALIGPFSMTFGFLIYENLRSLKKEVPFMPPKRKTKIGFILIGIAGILLIPTILGSIVLVSLRGAREKAKDVGIWAEMSAMRATAEIYYMDNNDSYLGFSCSRPQEAADACDYISEQLGKTNYLFLSR